MKRNHNKHPGDRSRLQRLMLGGGMLGVLLSSGLTAMVTESAIAQPLPIPEAYITPVVGRVTITLTNQTGAAIAYQLVDDTNVRTLRAFESVELSGVALPSTLTFRRIDSGLLEATIVPDSPSGTLQVNLTATEDFAIDRTAISIDLEGGVDVN
ncbi:hypothetical protein ACQ4M4_01220 [Leptolyngbya sp. AN02str]|uniref:hypothetical protein n=1 Tax=Leptolyngbya sp. AN02str TaxID=3423363 RepID=UPI003D318BA5